MAMTSTTRWQAAVKGAGIPIGTYKTVEQLVHSQLANNYLVSTLDQTETLEVVL